MNFRALMLYFSKNLLLGPQVGTRPLIYRLKYLQTKKRTNLSKFPNSFILKYYIVCFARQLSLRYIGKISEKNSWSPRPNPGSATEFWQLFVVKCKTFHRVPSLNDLLKLRDYLVVIGCVTAADIWWILKLSFSFKNSVKYSSNLY